MSGTPKKGIDYAGWATDIFDNESSPIDELLNSQGWIGFGVYFFLCQRAYSTDGYFYRWSYNNAASTARKMGGGIKTDTVKQVVSLCLQIGLFDNRLFDREGILTNKMIQKRYMIAIEKRSKIARTVNKDYWLLESDETKAYIVVPENSQHNPEDVHSLTENSHSLAENSTKESKVNESKGKESSGGATTAASPPTPAISQRDMLIQKYGLEQVECYEQRFDDWVSKKGNIRANKLTTISKWMEQDGVSKPTNTSSFDMDNVMGKIKNRYQG